MAENPLKAIRKVARWTLWTLAGGLALLAAAHLLLPYLVNSDRFKSKILARIDPAVYGRIDFADLTGKSVIIYGQHEVVKDLVVARLRCDPYTTGD